MSNATRNVVIIPQTKDLLTIEEFMLTRVAAYCRVSTEAEEQQNSYENQCKYYTDLIMNNPKWSFVRIYADEGISGTSAKKRDSFMQMIKDCKKKKIDLILTKSISRFARNTVDCLHYTRLLKSWGIAVYFEKENINTLQEDSEFLITLHGAFAQQEIESLSANVTWGIQQSMREGKVRIQYKKLYAYERGEDGNPKIIPDQAEVVKELYARYLAGASLRMLQTWLLENQTPNFMGKTDWTVASIKGILTNEKYCGDVLMQKTYTTDCITHKSKKNNGERPMYLVKDNHPAIIDRETFDAVQAEMARRTAMKSPSKKAPTGQAHYSSKYALSERLYCGECGTKYRRITWTKSNGKRVVWRCVSRLDYGAKYCHSPSIEEKRLQKAILAAINSAKSEQRVLINRIAGAMEIEILPAVDGTISIAEINTRLLELEKEFQALLSKAAGDIGNEAYMEDFRTMSEEIASLKEKKKSIEARKSDSEASYRIKKAVEFMEDSSSDIIEWDESMIRQVIDGVKVLSVDEILVRIRGGIEIRQRME